METTWLLLCAAIVGTIITYGVALYKKNGKQTYKRENLTPEMEGNQGAARIYRREFENAVNSRGNNLSITQIRDNQSSNRTTRKKDAFSPGMGNGHYYGNGPYYRPRGKYTPLEVKLLCLICIVLTYLITSLAYGINPFAVFSSY